MPKSAFLRAVFAASLLGNLVCVILLGKRLLFKPAAYAPPPRLSYYMGRDELFEALPVDSGAIIFLGNSLTQYFELSELLPGHRIKNRGIHGDELEATLKRMGPVIRSRPSAVFIELGINDIERRLPKQRFMVLYERLLDTLKSTLPQAKVYVQSVLPVADSSAYLPGYCSPETNRLVVDYNRTLQELAVKKGCTYIDLHKAFLSDRQLNPLLTNDGVHLSGEGYKRWADQLRKILSP